MINSLVCVGKLYSDLFRTGKNLLQNVLKMLLILMVLLCAIFRQNCEQNAFIWTEFINTGFLEHFYSLTIIISKNTSL
jgi:hypothetical protein